jgi:hypothetical protein
MSQIESQLRKIRARIDVCEALALTLPGAESDDLHLRWLKESLATARSSLNKINVEIVTAFRKQGKATDEVLNTHVSNAEDAFCGSVSGVFVCLDELNNDFGKEGNAPAVLTLEKIGRQSRKASRTLYLITRPRLAFFLSWRGLLLVSLIGLIASCLSYIGHYAVHPTGGLTRVDSVTAGAARDIQTVHEAAHNSDESFIDRTLKTTTTVVDLLPKIPKAILALTAAVAAFQGLLTTLVRSSRPK